MVLMRSDVYEALEEFKGVLKPTKKLRAFLESKFGGQTVMHAGVQRPAVDVILEDIESYRP